MKLWMSQNLTKLLRWFLTILAVGLLAWLWILLGATPAIACG
ncbi:hypothetical protein [Oxynema aestuarii]|jgi:hypothetical protein|nr:hypothetical protein [Oxynema aestuarii]